MKDLEKKIFTNNSMRCSELKGSGILVNLFQINTPNTEYTVNQKKKFKNQVNPVFRNLEALGLSADS